MTRVLAGALLAMSLAGSASAHRLDEYLQATLIGMTRTGVEVEIQLTPGVAVLPVVMAEIDRDRDGRISPEEERAYAGRVAREVELLVNGEVAALSLRESRFSSLAEMREGLGTIRLKLWAEMRGRGREVRFENRHLPQISAYLVNCLAGEGLAVGQQYRDDAQKSIRFEYSFGRGGAWVAQGMLWVVAAGILLLVRIAASRYPWKSRPTKLDRQ